GTTTAASAAGMSPGRAETPRARAAAVAPTRSKRVRRASPVRRGDMAILLGGGRGEGRGMEGGAGSPGRSGPSVVRTSSASADAMSQGDRARSREGQGAGDRGEDARVRAGAGEVGAAVGGGGGSADGVARGGAADPGGG